MSIHVFLRNYWKSNIKSNLKALLVQPRFASLMCSALPKSCYTELTKQARLKLFFMHRHNLLTHCTYKYFSVH